MRTPNEHARAVMLEQIMTLRGPRNPQRYRARLRRARLPLLSKLLHLLTDTP